MTLAYTAVFEQEANGGWAAYVPDLPTVLVSADTRVEAERLIREGIELYVEVLREDGKRPPTPAFQAQQFEISIAA